MDAPLAPCRTTNGGPRRCKYFINVGNIVPDRPRRQPFHRHNLLRSFNIRMFHQIFLNTLLYNDESVATEMGLAVAADSRCPSVMDDGSPIGLRRRLYRRPGRRRVCPRQNDPFSGPCPPGVGSGGMLEAGRLVAGGSTTAAVNPVGLYCRAAGNGKRSSDQW